MGLTVHYSLAANITSSKKANTIVESMRSICMDFPFEEVTNIVNLSGDQLQEIRQNRDHELFWIANSGTKSVASPSDPRISYDVEPNQIIVFTVCVGKGSESADFGLCKYPKKISITEYGKTRNILTKLSGYSFRAFCKTEYACNSKYGGMKNFLRCHISLISALEEMKNIPMLSVYIDDEGQYGPSNYSDDYEIAYAVGREPTYVDHHGRYSPNDLMRHVGSSDDPTIDSIKNLYPNLNTLIFNTSDTKKVKQFINSLK